MSFLSHPAIGEHQLDESVQITYEVPAVELTGSMQTQVLAHRGASWAERENTIAAFTRAVGMGAHGVELDVRRTLDGVLVVHHNAAVDDGGVIANLAYADLPAHICTLDQALDACRPLWVNVEIKNDSSEPDFDSSESIADETIRCLSQRPEGDERWLISCFRRETINRCQQLRPSIATAFLSVGVSEDEATSFISQLAAEGHSAFHPWVASLTKNVIDLCHGQGLKVNTWTCDDAQRMRELISWGIDGICTNVPDIALTVLQSI